MLTLEKIKEPVSAEIMRYEEYLRESLHSDDALVSTMLDYIFTTRGKGVRPLLVLLSAAMFSGSKPLPGDAYLAAMLIEMLHTASLVHDDVIDEAPVRRGKPSVDALWRSHRAVLIGDFIFARSYSIGMESGSYEIVRYITQCVSDLCEGELTQSDQADHLSMTREIYDRIIYKKTATMIGTSCGAGAMAAGASPEDILLMKKLGDSVGMAFQIKDDILDYIVTAKTGKAPCNDLHERKVTLPLLSVLERSEASERRRIISLLSDIRSTPSNADLLLEVVHRGGGIEAAESVMREHICQARTLLATLPASEYRDSLDNLFLYIAEREA